MIRRERVDVIVALTHLTFEQDRELAERFPEIDLIVGGHEHFPIAAIREPHVHQQGRIGREVRGADRPGEAARTRRSSAFTS